MSIRGPSRFRKREIERAAKAAKAAGADRIEVDPSTGKIVVILNKSVDPAPDANPWDEVYHRGAQNQKRAS